MRCSAGGDELIFQIILRPEPGTNCDAFQEVGREKKKTEGVRTECDCRCVSCGADENFGSYLSFEPS